jgi:hypothetical protein
MWSPASVLLSDRASREGLSGSAFTFARGLCFPLGIEAYSGPHGPTSFVRWDRAGLLLSHLPVEHSACSSRRDLGFDDVTDQSLSPFDEGQMVAEATLKQHAHTMVTGNIGGRHQRDVFRRAHVA